MTSARAATSSRSPSLKSQVEDRRQSLQIMATSATIGLGVTLVSMSV
jgi:hypothetical protein